MVCPSLLLYDELRMKCLLYRIGRPGPHFVASGRRFKRPRPSSPQLINRHYIDRHNSECKRKSRINSRSYSRSETDSQPAMWKSEPARLIGAGVPRDLLHNRLGHATAPFNFNSAPVHLREQLFPRGIDVAHRFQVNLQGNPGRRWPLLPAALKLLNPVPREFPLQLPSFGGICLLDRYLEHCLCFLRRNRRELIASIHGADGWPMCRNENTIIKQLIYNILRMILAIWMRELLRSSADWILPICRASAQISAHLASSNAAGLLQLQACASWIAA